MAYDENTPFDLVAIVAAILGNDVAGRVARECAGRTFLIPKRYSPRNPVCVAIGQEQYHLISREIGGITMAVKQIDRRLIVAEMSKHGLTVSEIAAVAHLSDRRVYQIRRKLREDGVLPVRARRIAKAVVASHGAQKP